MLKALHHRPSVHRLCRGVFLQEPLELSETITAVPLRSLGMGDCAQYAGEYVQTIGEKIDAGAITMLTDSTKQADPVVAIVISLRIDGSPEDLEKQAKPFHAEAEN